MIKELDLKALRDDGYLQEVNRQFFHPLGLALAIEVSDTGVWRLLVVDAREEIEGYSFIPCNDMQSKAANVAKLAEARRGPRFKKLGYWQQPI